MRKLICTAVAAVAAGCAAPPPLLMEDVLEANAPLICNGAEQCNTWWRRAQYWVTTNAGFKVQTATDIVIETYNPPNYSLSWAFRATREPRDGGSDRIRLTPSCGPAPVCQAHPQSLVAKFNRYVRTGF